MAIALHTNQTQPFSARTVAKLLLERAHPPGIGEITWSSQSEEIFAMLFSRFEAVPVLTGLAACGNVFDIDNRIWRNNNFVQLPEQICADCRNVGSGHMTTKKLNRLWTFKSPVNAVSLEGSL